MNIKRLDSGLAKHSASRDRERAGTLQTAPLRSRLSWHEREARVIASLQG